MRGALRVAAAAIAIAAACAAAPDGGCPGTATLEHDCSSARRASVGNCLICMSAKHSECASAEMDGFCSGPAKKPSFDIIWSGLWPAPHGESAFNLSAFPVLQENRMGWFGSRFGLYQQSYPPLGLPQTVDLDAHKAKVVHDITHDGGVGGNVSGGIVPAGKDMYCPIDWEFYTPVIFDHATTAHPAGFSGSGGCPGVYTAPDGNSRYSMPGAGCAMCNAIMNASAALVLQKTPGLNVSATAALAAAEFNAAARVFYTTTLEVAQKTRPDCLWGMYGKPMTEDIVPPFVNAHDRAVGDAYQWMFDVQDALYPSTCESGVSVCSPCTCMACLTGRDVHT